MNYAYYQACHTNNYFCIPTCSVADGKFYSGDAYIVLHSVKKGAKIEHHLHFWIGDECSQDESGIAAYKSVECDDALGGK